MSVVLDWVDVAVAAGVEDSGVAAADGDGASAFGGGRVRDWSAEGACGRGGHCFGDCLMQCRTMWDAVEIEQC